MIDSICCKADEGMPTKRERIMFLTSAEVKATLEKWAEEEGRSISNLVERIVLAAISEKQQTDTSK